MWVAGVTGLWRFLGISWVFALFLLCFYVFLRVFCVVRHLWFDYGGVLGVCVVICLCLWVLQWLCDFDCD